MTVRTVSTLQIQPHTHTIICRLPPTRLKGFTRLFCCGSGIFAEFGDPIYHPSSIWLLWVVQVLLDRFMNAGVNHFINRPHPLSSSSLQRATKYTWGEYLKVTPVNMLWLSHPCNLAGLSTKKILFCELNRRKVDVCCNAGLALARCAVLCIIMYC